MCFFFLPPASPSLSLFYNLCVGLTFYCFFFSPPLSNFPTDCLPVPSSVLSLHLRAPIWDGMPESPPFCRHDLNIACPLPVFLLSLCVCSVYVVCLPLAPAVLPLPLSLLIMSTDQLITCTDLYRHRLLVWRHWTERGSIVVHQWLDIYCILK